MSFFLIAQVISTTGSELDREVNTFFATHCTDCHGEESAKGDLRLHDLRMDFSEARVVDTWQNVLEKLETGEMPPKKKPRPSAHIVETMTHRIRVELQKIGVQAEIDHKLRSPDFGNHINHEKLFDGSHRGPSYSPSRLWRVNPNVYDRFVKDVGRGLREATAIHQPFAIDENKGVIADYAAQHFADSATLQLLMMNCQSIANYQTTGILKRERDGRTHRRRNVPPEFQVIIEGDDPATAEQLKAAITREFLLLLERPPTEAELAESLEFCGKAIKKAGKIRGFQTTLMSIMLKPEAVYRLEIGLGEEDKHGRRRLSPYELAFAIAYALTDKGPAQIQINRLPDRGEATSDSEKRSLLALAQEGKLESPEDIRRVVKQILDDNDMSTADYTMFASDHKIRNTRVLRFFRDFFGYHHAPRVFKDEKRIGIDSGFETKRMVNDADQMVMHIFDQDRNVLRRLLTSDEFFVAYPGSYKKFQKDLNYIRNNVNDANYRNNTEYIKQHEAKGRTPIPIEGTSSRTYVGFYNLDHKTWNYPTNQPFHLPKKQRAGILTHPAWLIAWSGNFDNDPIRRGKWIREHLLADTIPDVPITVNAVVPEDHDKTLRERLEATRADACWSCHKKMNPLGLPFESFDDFGRFRETEMLGETLTIFPRRHRNSRSVPVATAGEIISSGEKNLDGKVANVFELMDKLAHSIRVRQSFVRHAFRYWLGRNETLDDSPTLIEADEAYTENGGSMKTLIASLLSSDSFLYRK